VLMGKKRVGEGSKALPLPKKAQRAPSSFAAPSTTKGKKDAYLLILHASTRGLHFVNDEQRTRYEILTTRKMNKTFFMWRSMGLLDDMKSLIRNFEWIEYIGMQ